MGECIGSIRPRNEFQGDTSSCTNNVVAVTRCGKPPSVSSNAAVHTIPSGSAQGKSLARWVGALVAYGRGVLPCVSRVQGRSTEETRAARANQCLTRSLSKILDGDLSECVEWGLVSCEVGVSDSFAIIIVSPSPPPPPSSSSSPIPFVVHSLKLRSETNDEILHETNVSSTNGMADKAGTEEGRRGRFVLALATTL